VSIVSIAPGQPVRSSSNARQAQTLAALRLCIFPVRADKKPYIKDWENAATSDIDTVCRWWSLYPQALIGLPCRPNGIFVLDMDRHKEGVDGCTTANSLFKEHGLPSEGVVAVCTPRGGAHIYFTMPPEGLRSTTGLLGPGVDTRGNGGYVIAPGSALSDGRCWEPKYPSAQDEFLKRLSSGQLPHPPSWMRDKLKTRAPALGWSSAHSDSLPAAALMELEIQCQKVRGAAVGTRNHTLNSASFAMGQFVATGGIDREQAEASLSEAGEAAGLPPDEVERTIASGLAAGLRQPRTITSVGNLRTQQPSIAWLDNSVTQLPHVTSPGNSAGHQPHVTAPGNLLPQQPHLTSPGNLPIQPPWPDTYQNGKPKSGYKNAKVAVQALGIACQNDTFHGRKTIGGHPIAQFAGEITDDAVAALRNLIVETFGFDPGKENLFEAVNALCLKNQFDPICEWLDSLKWDGQARLDTWLITYAGAEDNELNRAVGVLLLIAMVRRARVPGCKYDLMVVLEGAQGCGKSSLLGALAGSDDNFTDASLLNRDIREVAEALRGRWVAEIPELSGLRKSDVEDVKAHISRTDDRARPAYGRTVESQKRRCVFVGTTNASEYLSDDTGNRRFLPVKVKNINLSDFGRDREQLFAEAVAREAQYGALTLPSNLWISAAAQAERRRLMDPWADILSERLATAQLETLPCGEKRVTATTLESFVGLQPSTSFLRFESYQAAWSSL